MKRILIMMSLVLMGAGEAQAETIRLKSDRRIEGEIIEQNEQYILLDVGIETPLTFYRDEIAEIIPEDVIGKEKSEPAAKSGPAAQKPAQQERHFLWKVQSDAATVYLFGSIHFGKPSMYPLPQVIEDAFRRSSTLVVEINLEALDPMLAQGTMMQAGTYTNGESIQKNLTPSTFKRLKNRLAQFSIPLEQVAFFKPWMMAMTLSVLQIKMLGFDESYGLDHYFLGKASQGGKEILELEGLEEQINFLDSIEDQDKFLDYTLISMDETEKMLQEVIQVWEDGDAEKMDKITITDILEKYPDTEPIFEALLFNRNRDMADDIGAFLETEDGKYFVVVGAAHLIGSEGIVELLKEDGFTVEQL